jgi:hypothetical protein
MGIVGMPDVNQLVVQSAPVANEMAVLQAEVLKLPQALANGGCTTVTDPLTAPHIQVGHRGRRGSGTQAPDADVRHPLAAVQPQHLQSHHPA